MFISKDTANFYGSLQGEKEDLEAINYALLKQVKPLRVENIQLQKDNVGLSVINEQLKLDKIILSVVIDKIGKEFEIPKEELVKIITDVERDYEDPKIKVAETKINTLMEERNNIEKTYESLKNSGYKQMKQDKGKSLER